MKPFQRWLMAFLGISCLVLSFYSYTVNQNLQSIKQLQQAQTSITGKALWLSWDSCANSLKQVLRAGDTQNQAEVLNHFSNAQIYCQSTTMLNHSYTIALESATKSWWNRTQQNPAKALGFMILFTDYSIQISKIQYAVQTEGLVSATSRAQIEQLHTEIETFTQQVSDTMLQNGNIAEIQQAIATWCGTVTDVAAKTTTNLIKDEYLGVCK
ncbi:hypothetical protein [Herpetosiphon geysericola]|uniref:Uncharacterized protein n=1 Tax=Herpetosiphon geysericola TaxID=70996 RepID=A0A0P6XIB2_9CHLR|nr:hypothetical protein [Herpetosiphon geysericola]KPL83364.1 hypothetical protein SE18_19320 [Herpetosiphon geysericola]